MSADTGLDELSTLEVELRSPVARVRMSRPEVLNAMSFQMRSELLLVLEGLEDADIRVAVLSGRGRAFCAGGDLTEMGGAHGGDAALETLRDSQELLYRLERTSIVVVAAVNGLAYGAGFSLALACDLAVASDDAVFCSAFTTAGLVPDMGGAYELARLLGRQRAAYLTLTDRRVGAEEARALGIVAAVWPSDRFEDEVERLAGQMGQRSPHALRGTKALLRSAVPVDSASLELERHIQARLTTSPEHAAAIGQLRSRPDLAG